jgi:membrane-bound lytic murein transglycosylase B
VSEWIALGVTPEKGGVQPKRATEASLLRVDDRAWLVTANYEALLAYNCAHNYAISVATLAARIAK